MNGTLSAIERMPSPRLSMPGLGTLFVLCVPIFAGICAVRGESLAIGGFQYSGFLWSGVLLTGLVLLVIEMGTRPQHYATFPVTPWLAWLALVAVSFCWMEDPAVPQIREAVQLGMPVLMGVIASVFVRSRARLTQLIHAFYYAMPILWIVTAMWAGLSLEQEIRDDVYVEVRWVGFAAVVPAALFITETKRHLARGWIGWAICLGVTVATGSRMASLATLLLPIVNPVTRNPLRKLAVLGVIGLIGVGLLSTPIFQERFFKGETGGVDKISQGEFDSAGRFDVWPLILDEALERPWLGHGVGTVQRIVPLLWTEVYHPHNDYLRLGYELGIVGICVFLSALFWQIWNLGQMVRRTDGVVQQAFAAAWLGLVVFLPIAFTGNPITYILPYMNPLFALMGAAYTVAWNERLAVAKARVLPAAAAGGSPSVLHPSFS